MASSARLVTIKRSGGDGAHFPLSLSSCLFGRSIECDIRIQLPVVSKKHCKIEINEQEAILYNFSSTNPTQVNGTTIDEPVQLKHGDIITIIDRSFRYENGNHEDGSRSTGFPEKSLGQEPVRRASSASFSDDPDGKGQDAKASKTTASRRSLVHAKKLPGDSSASDGSKDNVTQDPSNTCSSEHVEQHSGRNIGEPISGDLFKKSRASGSSYRELKSSPAHSLSNSKKNESPFEKLYQSMKEELDIKSQKPSRRKSEPQPECAAGKETWETKLLVSCKSRAKSSGSTPGTAALSPKGGKIWSENQSSAEGPLQTSTEAPSSRVSLTATAKTKTPVRTSQQLKNEDFHVSGRRESVNLDESEGAKAVQKIVTPRKLGTRNQTPVKVEDAASPADKPENLFSRKRRSISAKVEVLSAETQNWFSSTQHLAPGEKKTPKESNKPEKLATAAEQICSGLPGLSSVDISNFGDSINKGEGVSLKKRRVSFGGRLRPELFDENLPPNTPLKRGETPTTKRKSLAIHTPAVLKKIIKERPQSPGKLESPGITPPTANDQRRRSGRSLSASSDNKSLHQTDTPKKAGRKSGILPAKRASISRSQHDILQMICSKRRSGASEANLIVAKSWADVVKLGAKQTQTKVVKHVPQKQTSKRQRRPNTPKKPTSNLHNQFSTGHANSPCTIVIGRAQIEKASMPARPYKMLNNLMLNQKIDFNEDLSGLTEMFKTPVKEKQQQMNDMASILSNSENLPEKQFQVTNLAHKSLPGTSEILGENVLSSTRNAAKELSDECFASPTLRQRSIKNGKTVQTPKNIHDITHPGSVTELLKTVSSVNKLRSRELRHTFVESVHESTETGLTEGITGRQLRKTSLQEQEVDQQMQDSENTSQRSKEIVKLKEVPEKTSAMGSCTKEQKSRKDSIGSQVVTQTVACAEELLNQVKGTTETPEESMRVQNASISDGQRATKQKGDLAYATKVKRLSRTPDKKTQALEGPAGLKEPFETPNCRDKPIRDEKTKVLCKSPQHTPENTKTSTKPRPSNSGKKVEIKEHSAIKKFVDMSGGIRYTPKIPELEHGAIKALKDSENQMLNLTITGRKKSVGKAKEKAHPLENLDGFQELFLSPVPADKITKMPNKSQYQEHIRTPASRKRLSKTGLGNTDVKEELSTPGKQTKSSGRATHTPTASVLEETDSTFIMETPKQKLDFTENSTGHKKRTQAPKNRAEPLEDLDGFQELFQTPVGACNPVTAVETTELSLESAQAEPVKTPASRKRLSKTNLRKVDVKEGLSTPGKQTKSPGRATHTPTTSVLEESDSTAFVETPKQKLDSTENSTRRKGRSQAPKNRAQPLEDLDGFQELFQTPVGACNPVTAVETTELSLESAQAEPVKTPASRKRLSKTDLRKVDVKEGLSTPGKQTESRGRATHNPQHLLEETDSTFIMETPKQKLDSTENSTGCKRRSQVPKNGSEPLEDLDGFQELFQTPVGACNPGTAEETTKLSLESAQAEPVKTPASRKRFSKIGLSKADVREELSTPGKQTKSPGRTTHTPTAPVQQEKGIKAIMETSSQELEPVGILRGSKKQPTTPKEEGQSLGDLFGLQELFQTPDYGNGPLAVGKSKKKSVNALQSEPAISPKSIKRQSRASMGKMEIKEELSESVKHPQIEKLIDTLQEPDDNNVIRTSKQSLKRKLEPAASMPGSKRLRCASKNKTPCLEELSCLQQLFQTPGHAKDSVSIGEMSKILTKTPQSGPVRRQTSRKNLPKMSLRKMNVTEELSALWKQSPGKALTASVQQDNGIQAIIKIPQGKLETAANVTGLIRQQRPPKEKVLPLGDLDGFQELFQTPDHSIDPVIGNKRTSMSLKSPQPVLVRTPQTSKRLAKTSLGKVGVGEEISSLHMTRRAAGESLHIPSLSEDGRRNKDLKKLRTQALGTSVNVTRSKKQQRAHKERSQSPEDLFGLQELFQTPASQKELMTVCETTKASLESSEPELIRTPTSRKRLSKTGLGNIDVKEELSTPGKQTESPGRATHTPTASVLEETDSTFIMETPKQKLDFTENSTGHKKRTQAPKNRPEPLEDLDGFQELFQTPVGACNPVTAVETTELSLESAQAEPVKTPASRKRLSKTDLRKVDVKEGLSTPGKQTKSPGRATHIPTTSVLEESDSTAFVETPKQKLDSTENSTGCKRRSQAPKNRAQPLEDLDDGFQELFQTPVGACNPVTAVETTELSLESAQAEPVKTPASRKRLSKTDLRKVDVKEELSTPGKQTKSPGRITHIPTASVLEDTDSTFIMETPKQKKDFIGNSTGCKRRSQAPKNRAQPLEDLDGFQELFQTPVGACNPVTAEESTKLSLESAQVESVRTPASRKRLSKTSLGKVDVKEKLSLLSKPRCSSLEVMHASKLSVDGGRGTKSLKESAAQALDTAVSVTRSKRQRGACKKRSQSPEDLFGLQELFQTPGYDEASLAAEKLTKIPHSSPPPEPVETSIISQRQPKTRLMKFHVENELSGDRMLPQMSGEIMDISKVPEGEDKGIRTRKQSVKRKLDTAVSVPCSKRQRVAEVEKVQTLEDLPGFQELFQTPSSAVDSVTIDKTTKMPSKSPEPMGTTSKTQPGRRLRRVGVTKEPIAQKKTTRVLRETRNTHKEPVGDSKDVKELKESSMQKQDPAVSLTSKRGQSRTHKKTGPLEELPSIQEETATRVSCKSPQPEEKETSVASKRQLRIRLRKIDVKEEPTAQRKPTGRETRNTLKESMSDSGNVEELRESTKQKIDPATGVPVSKRPQRVLRERAKCLELAGPKGPGHTEESANDERPTQMPFSSPQPEQIDSLQTSPRRPRTRRGKVELDEVPSLVRKTVPTSRQTSRSHKVPEIDDKDTQASEEPGKQKLETVTTVTGSRRRQLRAPKDEVKTLEVPDDSKEVTQMSEHTEKPRHDTSSVKNTLQQMPDPIKPLRTSRRVLRASKEDTVKTTLEMVVDIRDPAESQSKSNTSLPPKRKSARDGSISRTRGLCSLSPKQEPTDEKPAPKKQRTAFSKRHLSPEPVKMKQLRIMSNKIEPVEEQISNILEEKEVQVENSAHPDQKMPLPSRNQKKTNKKQPTPKASASAEKAGIKKTEKTVKTSQETELQNTDDGAKKSTSRGKVSGKKTCLRSGGQSEIPPPHASEEKTSATGVEILVKTQKEKGICGDSDVRCLRSRKTGVTLDSEPKPRVTRGAKKDTKVLKKDEDIVYTTKLRTRSCQNSRNM
ncbi:proliferation marker protein Ki-67 [Phodopus roborovskii]|uniref:proliferation marker protein Ki-67 n=1 Tax=Phodopus roborovskii TaxID=109678 RepID=UPI0021E4E4A0|nr:proliferation marker protein Ki-67 [Phodopus roborovskii]